MMHRCSTSHGHMVGQCTCGLYHNQGGSFSMLFAMPNQKPFDYDSEIYNSYASPSPASVDCTLSLGTPSTRLSGGDVVEKRRPSSGISNFCWDILQSSKSKHASSPPQSNKAGRGSNSSGSNSHNSGGGDPLLARRCANCDTTSTPLWRNGPRGPKSLCNACGIRFKKEERRATAAGAGTTTGGGSSGAMEPHHMMNNSWPVQHYSSQSQKVPCYSPANEFRFIDDEYDRDASAAADSGIPFMSWRLNVTDRPSLVHDFTR